MSNFRKILPKVHICKFWGRNLKKIFILYAQRPPNKYWHIQLYAASNYVPVRVKIKIQEDIKKSVADANKYLYRSSWEANYLLTIYFPYYKLIYIFYC